MRFCMAHRGFSGFAPENTLSAFKLALSNQSVRSIELDVQLSKDGVPVVIHDFTLERTTNGYGFVKDKTYEELRELDAGNWFSEEFKNEKIPTLEEVLALCKDKCQLNIELKTIDGMYDGYEKIVVEMVKKYEMEDDVCLTSFDANVISAIQLLDTRMKRGLIISKPTLRLLKKLKNSGSTILSIKHKLVTPKLVKDMEKAGIELFAWTVNIKSDMKYILEYPQEITVCTNFPDRFEDLINSIS